MSKIDESEEMEKGRESMVRLRKRGEERAVEQGREKQQRKGGWAGRKREK